MERSEYFGHDVAEMTLTDECAGMTVQYKDKVLAGAIKEIYLQI